MTAPLIFKPATRRAGKLKIGCSGPSGSGKTRGALALAQGLAKDTRFAVIDTENGSASLYADEFTFDTLNISPPYLTEKFEAAVKAAVDAGYPVVVIDSTSPQWDGDGGILQRKEAVDARGGNHFSNWEPFTREHNRFRSLILHAPIHIVATMRSKMAYSQESNGQKTAIKKLGLQPIQRDGMEYEYTLVFDVQMDHKAAASKDRTKLFEGQLTDLLDDAVPKRLLAWLDTAAPEEVSGPAPVPVEVQNGNGAGTREPITAETPWPLEDGLKGLTLPEMTDKALLWILKPGRNLGPRTAEWQAAATAVMRTRERVGAGSLDGEKEEGAR